MGQLFSKKKEEEICPFCRCRCKRTLELESPRRVKRARVNEQEDGEVDDFSLREQRVEAAYTAAADAKATEANCTPGLSAEAAAEKKTVVPTKLPRVANQEDFPKATQSALMRRLKEDIEDHARKYGGVVDQEKTALQDRGDRKGLQSLRSVDHLQNSGSGPENEDLLQCKKCKGEFRGFEMKSSPENQNWRLREKERKSGGVSKSQPSLEKAQYSEFDKTIDVLLGNAAIASSQTLEEFARLKKARKTGQLPADLIRAEGMKEAVNSSMVPPVDQKVQPFPTIDISAPSSVSTFRTSCPCCNKEYQYLRSLLNFQVNCALCSELFIAREMKDYKEMQNSTSLPQERSSYSKPSKKQSFKSPSTAKKATGEERKLDQFSPNQVLKVNLVDVPSADFHDFDLTRLERDILAGQVWAIYDDQEGMPRYYARIFKVWYSPFRVNLIWLDATAATEKIRRNVGISDLIISCGDFKTGRASVAYEVNMFSHVVLDKFERTPVKILPRKGEVWAIYRDLELGAMASPKRISKSNTLKGVKGVMRSYAMVELLTDFSEEKGCSVVGLTKVSGFRAMFHRDPDIEGVKQFLPTDLPKFSHYVISKRMCEYDTLGIPAGAFELDPAATPPDLTVE